MDATSVLTARGDAMSAHSEEQPEGSRSFVTASILCALPIPGLVRFYTGYPFIGLFQLVIYPIGFIWSFIDLVRILTNRYRDSKGMRLHGYSEKFAGVVAIIVALFTLFIIKETSNSSSAQTGTEAAHSRPDSNQTMPGSGVGISPVSEAKENLESLDEDESRHDNSALEKNSVQKIDRTAEIEEAAKLAEQKKKAEQAKIANLRITKYPETTRELKKMGYSKTLAKYGLSGVKKINRLLPKVAEKAAQNPTMDRIAWVDVSSEKSTKNKLVFYAQAGNSNRIYITEEELNSDAPVYSNHERLKALLHQHEEMCERVIKSCLTHPSTYNKSLLNSASETQEYTNVIKIGFSAKNSFNLELEYEAIFRVNVDSEIVYQSIEEKK